MTRPIWQRYLAVIAYLIIALALSYIFGTILSLILQEVSPNSISSPQQISPRIMLYMLLCQMFAFLLPVPYLMYFCHSEPLPIFQGNPFSGLFCMGIVFLTLITFGLIYERLGVKPEQLKFLDKNSILAEKFYFLLATVVFAPFYEEYVFRGVIFKALYQERKLVQVIPAALVNMISFTLMHKEGAFNAIVLIPIFVLSLIFSYFAYTRQSLMPSIMGHMFQNLLASMQFFVEIK